MNYPIYAASTPQSTPPAKGGDLAVITCHFNWAGFSRPRQNLRRFLLQMRAAGIPVYGVEALLPGQPSMTVNLPGWRQVVVNNHGIMFQKEALLNAAEKLVPESYTKIAWVDADVWFDNPQWHLLTSSLLDVAPIVQPFAHAVWLDRNGDVQFYLPGAAHVTDSDPCKGHPGFAMAARRSMFRHGGLYGNAITGQGDIIFYCAVSKNPLRSTDLKGLGNNHTPYYRWRDGIRHWLDSQGGIVLATPGTVYHEWHGDRNTRGYVERHKAIANLDVDRHLELHPEGWVQWSRDAHPEMMAGVSGYFATRKEDG